MDLSKQKALALRLLKKVSTAGVVTVTSSDLSSANPTQTATVYVRLKDRIATTGNEPAKINAVMSATPFPVEGGTLLLNNVTYDIVEVDQSGVASETLAQNVVLHER
jgi:hypothetical protein